MYLDYESGFARPSINRASHQQAHQQGELLLAISHRLAMTKTLMEGVLSIVEIATEELDAERCSLFFNDPETSELYFLVAHDGAHREIRIPNTSGIAGSVFTTGQAAIIHDPYSDPRFNQAVDKETGFLTRSILCVPIKTAKGEIIGVAQLLNSRSSLFTQDDMTLFNRMVSVAVLALKGVHFPEKRSAERAKRAYFREPIKFALNS